MATPKFFENEFVRFEVNDGILKGTFKEGLVSLEIAKKIVAERLNFSNGKSYPLLITDVGLKSIKGEAREYLSTDEAIKGLKASAMVANNMFAKHLANFFVKISVIKPKIPTKIFSNEKDALIWLEQFK
jgi:hypothetical protein